MHKTVLVASLALIGSCRGAGQKEAPSAKSANDVPWDSSFAALCDTTKGRANGCVLRDQGRVVGPRPTTPP